jgi:hypothetical protein
MPCSALADGERRVPPPRRTEPRRPVAALFVARSLRAADRELPGRRSGGLRRRSLATTMELRAVTRRMCLLTWSCEAGKGRLNELHRNHNHLPASRGIFFVLRCPC